MTSEPESTRHESMNPADATQKPDDARQKVDELEAEHVEMPDPGKEPVVDPAADQQPDDRTGGDAEPPD